MGECPSMEYDLLTTFPNSTNTTVFTQISSLSMFGDPTLSSAHQRVNKLKFIAYGVVSSVIIALGILGNATNLAVLTRPNLKGVTFVYLTWLAISDLLSLLVSISSMFRLHGMQPRTYAAAVYYSHVEMPLVNALMASSVFLVVALTVDRYFSVCLPTRFKEVHNSRRAKRSIAAAYILALVLYIPVCFQKIPVSISISENETGFVACENTKVVNNTVFKIYLMAKEVVVRLGPVTILAILNMAIIVTFRRTLRKRKYLLNLSNLSNVSQQQRDGNKKYREEHRLIVLLAGIVILFFISMTPAAILTILNSDDKELNFGFQMFRAVANVLELSNYAMNFYVYCMCSSEIRRTFTSLATCGRQSPPNSFMSSKQSCESNTKV